MSSVPSAHFTTEPDLPPAFDAGNSAAAPTWAEAIRQQTERLDYGVVEIVVHDGRIQEISVTEKTRIRSSPPATATRHASTPRRGFPSAEPRASHAP